MTREETATQAADVLHITQPTLSRQLAQLEDELGVRLFEHQGRKILLTSSGMLLRRRAEEILELVDKTEQEVGQQEIDTAAAYANEEAVGVAVRRAIADGICTREELFITTKLRIQDYPNAKEGFEVSLNKLGLEYIDLYLLHQPIGDYYSAWRTLEDIYKCGKAKDMQAVCRTD